MGKGGKKGKKTVGLSYIVRDLLKKNNYANHELQDKMGERGSYRGFY